MTRRRTPAIERTKPQTARFRRSSPSRWPSMTGEPVQVKLTGGAIWIPHAEGEALPLT